MITPNKMWGCYVPKEKSFLRWITQVFRKLQMQKEAKFCRNPATNSTRNAAHRYTRQSALLCPCIREFFFRLSRNDRSTLQGTSQTRALISAIAMRSLAFFGGGEGCWFQGPVASIRSSATHSTDKLLKTVWQEQATIACFGKCWTSVRKGRAPPTVTWTPSHDRRGSV